jgi:protein arginine N-methyltransferase 3
MGKMRHLAQELVVGGECEGDTPVPAQCIKAMKLKDDEGYFNTYSHFSIHHEMLSVSLKAVTLTYSLFCNGNDWQNLLL